MIPHHLAHQDFSGAGVYVAWSGGVGSTGGHVADTVIADIVGVEVGVVGGVVLGDHHVLEAGSLEGLVPVFDTSLDGSSPLLGEGRVYIVYYLLLGLNQLAVVVLLQVLVLGFHAPAVDELLGVDVVLVGRIGVELGAEVSHAAVLIAHLHGLLGQSHDRTAHLHGVGSRLGVVVQSAGNLKVLFKALYSHQLGGRCVERGRLGRACVYTLADGGDALLVGYEERCHVDEQCILARSLYLEGLHNGVYEVAVECLFNGVSGHYALVVLVRVHVYVGRVGREREHEGSPHHFAGIEVGVLAGAYHAVGHQIEHIEVALGHLQQQLALLVDIGCEHTVVGGSAVDGLVKLVGLLG